MNDLTRRARRHGIKSKYAGDEPRNNELTAHLSKPKIKRRRFPLSKRAMKLRRKDRANRRADLANHKARFAAPWSLYVKEER